MGKANNEFNWTDKVTLQAHFEKLMEELCKHNDEKFLDLEQKINLRFDLNKIALDKAETATNIRLEGMNEFRDAMKDQQTKYLTASEYDVRHQLLVEKIEAVQKMGYMLLGILAAVEFAFKFLLK
jgi:hypothetical protein